MSEDRSFVSWVASYPRSGSTWVRSLMAAYIWGEKFSVDKMDLLPGEPPVSIYRMLWPKEGKWTPYDWAWMRPLALRYQHSLNRYPHFVLKTHTANIKLEDVPLIPKGYTNRAIYVKRDPRDVLVSCAKYFNVEINQMWERMQDDRHALTVGDGVYQFTSSYKMHVNGWLHVEHEYPVLTVNYEDVLHDPAMELTNILKFLNPDATINDDRVNLAVEMTAFAKLKESEKKHGFKERPPGVTSFFNKGKSGTWRDALPKELAEEVKEVLGAC